MTSNLKVILSAVGVAALVASPAMAKSHVRTHHFAPAGVPVYGQVYTTPPYAGRQVVTPYAPNLPQQAHETPGQSPDFQLGGEKK
jgi:hypothetical protein